MTVLEELGVESVTVKKGLDKASLGIELLVMALT